MKASTHLTIDVEVLAAAQSLIDRRKLSSFVEDCLRTHLLMDLPEKERGKIPIEKVLTHQVVSLKNQLKEFAKTIRALETERTKLKDKYDRMMSRRR